MTQSSLAQRDFSVGIVRGSGPESIDPRAVYDHIDGLYEADGGAYARGGSAKLTSKIMGATGGGLTNLITNPSFETNTTGWTSVGSGVTLARIQQGAEAGLIPPAGSYYLRVITDGTAATQGVRLIGGDVAVSSSTSYVASVWTCDALGQSMQFGVFQSDGSAQTVTFTENTPGVFTRRSIIFTTGPTTTGVDLRVYVKGTAATTFRVDGFSLVQEDALSIYFDGDSDNGQWSGTAHASTSLEIVPANVMWVWDGYFDVGRRTVVATTADFYALDATETPLNLGSDGLPIPKPSALMESMLFIGGGYIYGGSRKTANYSTGTISVTKGSKTVTGTGTTWNTLVDAGMLLQRGNERVYVVDSVDSTTQLTLRDAYEGVTGTGISYTLSPLYKITTADPYEDGDFYAVAANRLLTGFENTFKFSETQKPHKWTLTAGTPPAEIPNTHDLPEGVRLTGIGVIGNTVLMLTTGGIWTLNGIPFDIVDNQGNTNHRIEILSRELIAFGQTATWQQALIVPCLSGIFLIDGVSAPRRISRPIDQLYQDYTNRLYQSGQPAAYNDHFVLPIITGTGKVKDILVARLDRPIRVAGQPSFPWSRQTAGQIPCPAFAVRYDTANGEAKLLGASRNFGRIVDCSMFWFPSQAPLTDANGAVPNWTLVTRDYETGGLTDNTVRTVRPRYELDSEDGSAEIQIEYGYGARPETGPRIGEVEFGGFQFGTSQEEFFLVTPTETDTFGESNSLHPQHGRVNAPTRSIRYRFSAKNPRRRLRLRSVENFIRPSEAVRR